MVPTRNRNYLKTAEKVFFLLMRRRSRSAAIFIALWLRRRMMDRLFSMDNFHITIFLIGAVLLFVAVVIALTWLGISLRTRYFRSRGLAAIATIVGYQEDDESTSTAPVVEFLDPTRGMLVRACDARHTYNQMPKEYSLGNRVSILYLPHAPQKILLNTRRNIEHFQNLLFGMAAGCFVVGGILVMVALLNLF
jgi:hypothetical protein